MFERGSDFGFGNPLQVFGLLRAGRLFYLPGVRNRLGLRSGRQSYPGKFVKLLVLSSPNWSIFVRLIIGWSQVQVLVGLPIPIEIL